MEKTSTHAEPAALPDSNPVPTVKEIRDPRILIGCPAYGGMLHGGFVCSLIGAFATKAYGHLEFFFNDSLVNRARNNIAHTFLNGRQAQDEEGNQILIKFDWLLFLDTDLIFKPEDVQTLYELAVKRGPGIYAGSYPMKKFKPQIVYNALPGQQPDQNGVVSVREAGTGFLLVHRDVFTKMRKAHPEFDFVADQGDAGGGMDLRHDYFTVGVKRDQNGQNPRFLSEDWFFCQKWIDLGGQILMQTKICAQHIGQFVYPPNPAEIIEVADIYRRAYAKQGIQLPGEPAKVAAAA